MFSLTINGHGNPALTPDKNNYRMGVVTDSRIAEFSRLHLEDVSILHTYRRGIQMAGTGSTDNLIKDCKVDDVSLYDGMISYGSATFVGNVVSNTPGASGIRGYALANEYWSNTVVNAMYGIVADTDAVVVGNQIRNVTVGIVMNNLFYPDGSYAVIQDNEIGGVGDAGSGLMYGVGMSLVNLATGSVVSSNRIDITSGSGVIGMNVWWNPGQVTIQSNAIALAGDNIGIYLQKTDDESVAPVVKANRIGSMVAGQGWGLYLDEGEDNGNVYASIQDNVLTNLAKAIFLDQDVAGKTIRAAISNNTLQGNTVGIEINGTAEIVARRNVLSGNTEAAVKNNGTTVADAASNYWGAADGPGPVASGSGDKVSVNVTYYPWYMDAAMTELCEAVAITAQPSPVTMYVGGPASFTVAATGTAPLQYQWQRNTVNISLATNPTYALTAVTAADAGAYRCLVGNLVNTVTSETAALTVTTHYTENFTIEGDLALDGPLSLAPGVTLTINGQLTLNGGGTIGTGAQVIAGKLIIPDGQRLDVLAGSLTVAGATVYGTFTLDDSLGTLVITDDFIVDGGTNLWSDSHVVVSNAAKHVTIESKNGAVFGVSNCVIEAAAEGSNYYFLAQTGTEFRMTDSTLSGCGTEGTGSSAGLYVDTDTALLERNTLTNNVIGVVFGVNAANALIRESAIVGNTDYGVYNNAAEDADARSNWWGHVSGPYHATLNPYGQGNPVGDNVLFDPWYADAGLEGLVEAQATHETAGYYAGLTETQVVTIVSAFAYPTNRMLTSLLWGVTNLPAGWTLGDARGDGSPQANTDPEGNCEISFIGSLTSNPVRFEYDLNVPASETGKRQVRAWAAYWLDAAANEVVIPAVPDPLDLPMLLTVTPKAVSVEYDGTTLDNAAYSTDTDNYDITGFASGDTIESAGIALSGCLAFNGATDTVVSNAGTYALTIGTLAMSSTATNYVMAFTNPVPNAYVITNRLLTVGGTFSVYSKVYDGTDTAVIGTNGLTLLTPVSGEDVTLDAAAAFDTKDVGTGKTVTLAGSMLAGADIGNYTLSLDGAPTTTADITFPEVAGTVAGPGFRSPSASLVLTNTFSYPESSTLAGLTWAPILPDGWALTGAAGAGAAVDGTNVVFPVPPTERPVVFTCTISVPGNQAVSQEVSAAVSFRLGSMADSLTTNLAPATLYRYHNADYRALFRKIDGTELGRILAYWRAGAYYPNPLGHDGYAPSLSPYGGSTNEGLHSADYQDPRWEIDGTEMGRVLTYWRTGGYHVDPEGLDGYAHDRSGIGPNFMRLGGAAAAAGVTQAGPSVFVPGETVQVTATFVPGDASLVGLGWTPRVPSGWTVVSVSGDGQPELVRGEVLCLASVLPTGPMRLVYTVRVPASEARARCALGLTVTYSTAGRVNPQSVNAVPLALRSAAAPDEDEDDATREDPPDGASLKGVPNADFDGDGCADRAVYDEATGVWQARLSGSGGMEWTGTLGGPSWAPAAADYDGDGLADPAVYREATGEWQAKLSSLGYAAQAMDGAFGGAGWAPAAADYDGDGLADPAVYRAATGEWRVKLSAGGYIEVRLESRLGGAGWLSAPADYDGDGRADRGVYRPADGTWTVLLPDGAGEIRRDLPDAFGDAQCIPVPGDYDGDGLADPALYNPTARTWLLRLSSRGYELVSGPAGS